MVAAPRHGAISVAAHLGCKKCSFPTLNILSPSCASDGAEILVPDSQQGEGRETGSPEQALPDHLHPCLYIYRFGG